MIISLDKIGGAHRSKDRRIHEKDATGRGVWNTYLGVELHMIWRLPSLIELTPIIHTMGLTHLGLEASIYL